MTTIRVSVALGRTARAAWRHFVAMRASEHADVEMRELAVACLRELQQVAGNVFADFRISALPDGTEVAASPLVGEG